MSQHIHYGRQSILEHGYSVFNYFNKIIEEDTNIKIPEWYKKYKSKILENLFDFDTIKKYHIFHDCGKGRIIQYDENGRPHYPDHANKSKEVWLENGGDELIGELIGLDMVFHTETPDEILKRHLDIKIGCTLLMTALAELHANAELFGGIKSESFCIKFKKLEKRAKKCLYEWFDHKFVYGFVRNNISNSQKAVQLGHATLEAGREFIKPNDVHPSLIYCVVKSEERLFKLSKELFDNNIKFKTFREPDMNNELTSIATEPLSYNKKHLLKRYQLLI